MTPENLDRFALPQKLVRSIRELGGFDSLVITLAVLEARIGHQEQDVADEVWKWIFGEEYVLDFSEEERLSMAERVLHIFQELQPLFLDMRAAIDADGIAGITDQMVEHLQQVLFKLSAIFQGYEYSPKIDSNGIPHTKQPIMHLVNTIAHNHIVCLYADVLVPIFNELFPEKQPLGLNAFKVFIMLHDLGRWISQHPLIHERFERVLFEALGVPELVLGHEFEAEPRFSGDNPDMRSFEEILKSDHQKVLMGLMDVIGKFRTEHQQDTLRTVDALELQVEIARRAAHYAFGDRIIPGEGVAYINAVLELLAAGTPKQQEMSRRYGNEIAYYGKVIAWFNNQLAALDPDLSLDRIRERIDAHVGKTLAQTMLNHTARAFIGDQQKAAHVLLEEHVPVISRHRDLQPRKN